MVGDYSYKEYFVDLWNALPGSKLLFGTMLFLRMIAALGQFVSLYIVGLIVDFFTTYSSGDSLQPLVVLVALMIAFNVAAVLLRFYSKSHIQVAGLKMQQSLRLKGLRKLLSLDLSWHENENSGAKIKKIARGAESAENFMNLLSNDLTSIIVGTITVIVIFIFAGWKYLLFILLFAVLFVLSESYYAKRIYLKSKELFIREEKLTGKAQEISNNIVSVKSLGLHAKLDKNLSSQEKIYKQKWLSRKKTSHGKGRFVNSAIAIGHGLFLLLIATDVVSKTLTVGMMVVYLSYYSRFAAEVTRYSNIAMQLINFKTRFERLKTVLEEPDSNLDPVKGRAISKTWRTISFDDITFSYKQKIVLKDFSLKVKRSEKVGIVGLSGSGKSTLIKLFLRLYKPQKGQIRIGSVDLFDVRRANLRSNVTVVLQDQELFNLSLKDNILIAGQNGNNKLFKQSIKQSALSSVVSKLPKKEHTLIGEKGYRLSGGERQRLGIARAIYRDADILVLDEATSHLDSETESHIQQSLESLKDKTVLVIAHRLATLKNVDRIIFVKDGVIAESGTFQELLDTQGLFYKLWQKQELSS